MGITRPPLNHTSLEPPTQPIINQENQRTTRHSPRNRNPTPRIQTPHPLRPIHLPERPRKRPLRRVRSRDARPELLLSLHRALDRVRGEERKVVRDACACTRYG